LEVLNELAKEYKETYKAVRLLTEYRSIAFFRLAALLDKEGIENNIRNVSMVL